MKELLTEVSSRELSYWMAYFHIRKEEQVQQELQQRLQMNAAQRRAG